MVLLQAAAGFVQVSEYRNGLKGREIRLDGVLARRAVPIPGGDWWILGMFPGGKARYAAKVWEQDSSTEPVFPLPHLPEWAGVPGTEFTDLQILGPEVHVITPLSPYVFVYQDIRDAPVKRYPISIGPEGQVPRMPQGPPPEDGSWAAYEEWLATWDSPVAIHTLTNERLAVVTRRQGGKGLEVSVFQKKGVLESSLPLPPVYRTPTFSWEGRLFVWRESGKSGGGSFVHVDPASPPREHSARLAGDGMRLGKLMRLSEPSSAEKLIRRHGTVLLVDIEQCKGDAIRGILRGYHAAGLAEPRKHSEPAILFTCDGCGEEEMRRSIRSILSETELSLPAKPVLAWTPHPVPHSVVQNMVAVAPGVWRTPD